MNHLSFIDIENEDLGQYKALWPGKWPVSKLLKRRMEIGSQAFAQKYNSETLDDIGRTIPVDKIRQACESGRHIKNEFSKEFLSLLTIASGMDLASGQTAAAKWTVHLVLGQDPDGLIYVLHMWREKASYPKIKRQGLYDTASEFDPLAIVVENNSMQQWLIEDIADDDTYSELPVIPFRTGTNKMNMEEGLPSITTLFQNNRVVIPYGDTYLRDMFAPLLEELQNLPLSATTDCVMAFWFATKGLKELRGESPGKAFTHNFMIRSTPKVTNVSNPGRPVVVPANNVMIFDEVSGKYRYRRYNE